MRSSATAVLLLAVASMGAAPSPWPGLIKIAWPAPVGHFQPRAADIPADIPLSPSLQEQEALDRELDAKLKICRSC
jgi:hypothetical protein